MQVASRFLLVWGIAYPFPEVTFAPTYSSMLCAWSSTEIIRYTFFAWKLGGSNPPYWLQWLRYSAFIVLYPIGISSELYEVYLAGTGPARALLPPWVVTAAMVSIAVIYAFGMILNILE
jgi:very-long-chain (3R)-3-hydroxyacyl-CoA dehydratase